MSVEDVLRRLTDQFPDLDCTPHPLVVRAGGDAGQVAVHIPAARLLDVMRFLRDDPACRFEQLTDVTCVDYLHFPSAVDRYGVVYLLLSLTHNHRLCVKCFVNDPDPLVPTVTGVWPGAEWPEREVYDMFGIRFAGHPDLRRILTWDGFQAYPLRKDYPVRGRGEREDYEVLTRESG